MHHVKNTYVLLIMYQRFQKEQEVIKVALQSDEVQNENKTTGVKEQYFIYRKWQHCNTTSVNKCQCEVILKFT